MTRTIILIRHCKSDWDGNPDDHARPLSARGQRAAPRIGAFLASHNLIPDIALCSDALRTRQTWAGIADNLPGAPSATLDPALYLAAPQVMLNLLQATEAKTLAMVAHNPGISALAWDLAKTPPTDDRFAMYPTGATTVFRFDQSITPGTGDVLHFTTPRVLPDPR